MPTKLWLKSSVCWVLGTGLYTQLHKLGIHCWASSPGSRRSYALWKTWGFSFGCQKKSCQRRYSDCTTEPVPSPRSRKWRSEMFIPVKRHHHCVVPWMGLTPTGWSTEGHKSLQGKTWHGQNSVRAATANFTLVSCWVVTLEENTEILVQKEKKSLQLLP